MALAAGVTATHGGDNQRAVTGSAVLAFNGEGDNQLPLAAARLLGTAEEDAPPSRLHGAGRAGGGVLSSGV
eukprot:scaffold100161_cov36-Phaeocystis_antarctica.AAC.1